MISKLENRARFFIYITMEDISTQHGKIEILDRKPEGFSQIDQLEALAHMLDNAFVIPGTNIRFGVDSLIGLIPVLGDTISLAISAFIMSYAKQINLPKHKIWHMRFNVFIDWLIGIIPFVGDAFDIGWKANRRNVKIMRDHIEKENVI